MGPPLQQSHSVVPQHQAEGDTVEDFDTLEVHLKHFSCLKPIKIWPILEGMRSFIHPEPSFVGMHQTAQIHILSDLNLLLM